ncbi:MAG: hypothetical protein U9Q74_04300 [Gemmatimonadota bacterium]|nr:hypothetical protein [Gemmatimonadota bacterium]
MLKHSRRILVAAVALLAGSQVVAAQDTTKTAAETKASLARRGAGINVGTWGMVDDPATGGAKSSESPLAEGWFRKGIDKHLALETTAGVWRRVIEVPASGGIGGSAGGKTTAILIPQMTSIKLYPFTVPEDEFEPFVSGGVGFTLGFQSQSGGGGVLGNGGGTGLIVGVGASGAAGVEWRFSTAFGLAVGAHYTYVQFFDDLAGERMYRGTGVKAGLTYRFQY